MVAAAAWPTLLAAARDGLRRWRLLSAGLLSLLGGLLGGRAQLGRHRFGQLDRQWGADRHRRVTAPNDGVRQCVSGFGGERVDLLVRAVDDATDHPAIAVDADEPDTPGLARSAFGPPDDLATPRAVLDPDFGDVLAQRVGQFGGDFPPQPRGLRCGVGGDGEAAVWRHHPHRAWHALSVSSTCTCPASGIGISTEPRSSRASSAVDGSSKSSMSNGPSSSPSVRRRRRCGGVVSRVVVSFAFSECHQWDSKRVGASCKSNGARLPHAEEICQSRFVQNLVRRWLSLTLVVAWNGPKTAPEPAGSPTTIPCIYRASAG